MSAVKFDFLVIGSGLAGLSFALEAAQHGRVAILTKSDLVESNTNHAQGGIAASMGDNDSWELHEKDTLIAGGGINDPAAVRYLVQNGPAAIEWLLSLGATFERSKDGKLALGREGGHSRNRIVHHADKSGWEVERAVSEAVRANPNIRFIENAFVTGLIMEEGRCIGASVHIAEIGLRAVVASAVMLATGGCGKMFRHTTNPSVATGDGIALASLAGARIANMEFMQFHPTTLSHPQLPNFLISEAVRGAGGNLRNHMGRRFMYDYDKRLELAPRDVVARAIVAEMQKLETWCVYLDVTHLKPADIQREFPTIWGQLRSVGIEMEKEWIPVVPAQHFSCGGVVTDIDGATNVPGLYAAGEVACTGVHGANRLASNSLLEAVLFGRAAGRHAAQGRYEPTTDVEPSEPKSIPESDAVRIRHSLQKRMTECAGIVRTNAGLREGLRIVESLRREFEAQPAAPYSPYALEARNLLIGARYVLEGALSRKENVGLHYNLDLIKGVPEHKLSAKLPEEAPSPKKAK